MVPGVDVARLNENTWAISIRGFNYRYSGKVLVLIDGRSVYNSLFSGVYWDQQTMPLENIDRIEVIRGPGGTVWGANAMNGVINIITKSAKDSHGGLVTAQTGSPRSCPRARAIRRRRRLERLIPRLRNVLRDGKLTFDPRRPCRR